ncbi:2-amino-4-hydroxy-6-hydroxymethyldihydropteridine diphosphokinase [Ketobacter sp. MCCC 1A13808]|uniref:2-amino-4-hydroxy-6- hydroxymethyldihydropteridine diphosphokinase n=1 Tax=Ketobacter sp. MCCC 1A13808 TaxID=2602738 RepID=UPI000F1FE516|nr:2-amino-4-hydroxy-6-hydroxymethyldihydropteridine diphosphokinase [Ketobacter sp. MCCC 1A13808]MVF13363.1 2-amino-4-hydroxy-6-hydroxymethyldihydropteridine diphosphokinase [Ketobacter sp. MCCC 1A13808]RLP54343.1 MAG: 2-amino-4-hydroxy-6-hydroxymethyldihydropteridine diphosphokinase [Ketobacter sp.]
MKHHAYIGLGSNLQSPALQLESALQNIGQIPHCRLLVCSPFYGSKAIGPGQQPDYVNAVALLQCDLPAMELLHQLQRIELEQGRERGPEQWVPRTLDLDILLFDRQVIDTERLQIPHPRLQQRNFVLKPLFDLAPDLVLPDGKAVVDLLKTTGTQGLWQLPDLSS